jgi:hypothetical protein
MNTYVVTETVPCVQVFTYIVKAKNREEALEMIVDGKIEAEDIATDELDYDNAEYDVEKDDEADGGELGEREEDRWDAE